MLTPPPLSQDARMLNLQWPDLEDRRSPTWAVEVQVHALAPLEGLARFGLRWAAEKSLATPLSRRVGNISTPCSSMLTQEIWAAQNHAGGRFLPSCQR